jgi:hypothetical protein
MLHRWTRAADEGERSHNKGAYRREAINAIERAIGQVNVGCKLADDRRDNE